MIDTNTWDTRTVDVLRDLYLDPLNVRLDLQSDVPEPDIMLDLFRNEKALNLVEGIVKVGYLTHELPIAVRRKRKLVVVEGNRRVAALKAIHNPYLVPDFQARISALVKGFTGRDQLKRIQVKIAPNQGEANQLVATLHAGNPRVAWTPARQAAFFQAQIDAGRTLAQLRSNYPMIDVDKYVLRSEILGKFRSVAYSSPDLVGYVHGRSFSTSALARIYESREFTDLAGLKLDASGRLTSKLSGTMFRSIAEEIVRGMHEGNIDTRSVGRVDAPRFQSLMEQLRAIVANKGKPPSGGTGGTSGAGAKGGGTKGGASGGAGGTGTGSGARGGSRQRTSSYLDVAHLKAPAAYPASIDRILQEFSTLNVDSYPNAAFDLIRTLLEKTIKSFAESKNENLKPSGLKGYVFLANCLAWLEGWFKVNGPTSQVQVVKKVRSDLSKDFHGSQDLLNAINHNHHIFASGDDVRTAWDTMKSLVAEMLK